MEYQITDIYELQSAVWHEGRGANVEQRPNFGFVICDDSEFTFISDGKEYIADAHHLLVLPRGAKYHFKCRKGGNTYTYNFEGQVSSKQPISIELHDGSQCLDIAREILKTDNIYTQIGLMYRIIGAVFDSSDGRIPQIIRPQVEYIHSRFSCSSLSNKFLASMTNVSEIYFRRIFTQTMGVPPHEYIMNLRIERAKMLLSGGEDVSGTAEICGFSSPYYFSAAFKKKVGMSPSSYAKKYGII